MESQIFTRGQAVAFARQAYDGFNKVFEWSFDDITFEFSKGVDIADLIDQLEELDMDDIELDYPANCSYCDLTIDGYRVEVWRRVP